MFLEENAPNTDIKILATDVSPRVLKEASSGIYSEKAAGSLGNAYLNKYFTKVRHNGANSYTVDEKIKCNIVFRGFNLVTGNYGIFKEKI